MAVLLASSTRDVAIVDCGCDGVAVACGNADAGVGVAPAGTLDAGGSLDVSTLIFPDFDLDVDGTPL